MKNLNMKAGKVLFIRLSAIGDVVHTLPCARLLKEARPEISIEWLVEKPASFLVEMNPYVDKVHIYPRKELAKIRWRTLNNARQFIRSLKEEEYGLAIDFQGLTKSSAIPFLARIPSRIGFGGKDGREISRLFNKVRIHPPEKHIILRNCSLLEPLIGREIQEEDISLPYVFLHEKKCREIQNNFADFLKHAPVIINPGGGWKTKIWPPAFYRKLIRMLADKGYKAGISWGPGEEKLAQEIYAPFTGNKRVSLLPSTTLFELASIIQKASLVIGPDTGPIHIAAGLNRPVVSIFGPSDHQRNAPWSSRAVSLQEYFPCGPCWNKHTCKHDLRCLVAIEPEAVHQAAMRMLE